MALTTVIISGLIGVLCQRCQMFSTGFIIEGDPVAKGRPKFARRGKFVSVYTPEKTKTYETKVAEIATNAMGDQEPLETPVVVSIWIYLQIPKSYSKKRFADCINQLERPTKKPDIDNVAKAVTDAMNGIVYQDDSQIVSIHIHKYYASTGSVIVFISEDLP